MDEEASTIRYFILQVEIDLLKLLNTQLATDEPPPIIVDSSTLWNGPILWGCLNTCYDY